MMKKPKPTHGGKRTGSGRRPLPAAELRRNINTIKLTDAEQRTIEQRAGAEPLAIWIRRQCGL